MVPDRHNDDLHRLSPLRACRRKLGSVSRNIILVYCLNLIIDISTTLNFCQSPERIIGETLRLGCLKL